MREPRAREGPRRGWVAYLLMAMLVVGCVAGTLEVLHHEATRGGVEAMASAHEPLLLDLKTYAGAEVDTLFVGTVDINGEPVLPGVVYCGDEPGNVSMSDPTEVVVTLRGRERGLRVNRATGRASPISLKTRAEKLWACGTGETGTSRRE